MSKIQIQNKGAIVKVVFQLDPQVKRAAEAKFKAEQASKDTQSFQAPQNSALSDRDIAANMLAQAKAMEVNANNMIAEAARMKKEAERMDPTVTAKAIAPTTTVTKAKRGRPAKVADAAQS